MKYKRAIHYTLRLFTLITYLLLYSCGSSKVDDTKIEQLGRLSPEYFSEKRSGSDTVFVEIEFKQEMPLAPPHIAGNYYISSVSYASLNFFRYAWRSRYFNFHTKSEIDLQRDRYYKLIVNWESKEFDDKITFNGNLVTPSVQLSYFYDYYIVSSEEIEKNNIPIVTEKYLREINER